MKRNVNKKKLNKKMSWNKEKREFNIKDDGPYGFWGKLSDDQAQRLLKGQNVGDYIFYQHTAENRGWKDTRVLDYNIMAVVKNGFKKYVVNGTHNPFAYIVYGSAPSKMSGEMLENQKINVTFQEGIDYLICLYKDVLKTAIKFNPKHYHRIIENPVEEKHSFFGKKQPEPIIDYILERYTKVCK
jgi:hypothetical protein